LQSNQVTPEEGSILLPGKNDATQLSEHNNTNNEHIKQSYRQAAGMHSWYRDWLWAGEMRGRS
jgi:hypothetical protein